MLACLDFEGVSASEHFGFDGISGADRPGRVSVASVAGRGNVLVAELETTKPQELLFIKKLPDLKGNVGLTLDFDVQIVLSSFDSTTVADLHLAGTNCEESVGLGVFAGPRLGRTREQTKTVDAPGIEWRHVTAVLRESGNPATPYEQASAIDGTEVVRAAADLNIAGCNRRDLRVGLLELSGGGGKAAVKFDHLVVRTVKSE